MNKLFYLFIALMFTATITKAQTIAMDFNRSDCQGNMHHLYSELEDNNVIIMEFFMINCNSCIVSGNKLKALHATLENEFPGHVKSYAIGYDNSYSCFSVSNWVGNHGFTSTPFDSGAAMVAYYGGFGMPTVAVVAGNNHEVLFTSMGFGNSDSTTVGAAIRNYFATNPLGVDEIKTRSTLSVYPNPAHDNFAVKVNLQKPSDVTIQLYSITGQSVLTINKLNQSAGVFSSSINTSELSQGVYMVKVSANGISELQKIIIVK